MRLCRFISLAIIVPALTIPIVFGQQQQPAEEVVRITTELVQTGVVVVDKRGQFVDGLKQEQFVLKVDGQPVTPSFFEQVVAGTKREEQLEKSVGGASTTASNQTGSSYRGRSIIFFIDDLHLSADSVQRTRKGILDFIDREMTLEDQVAIASPSGQIGFLQRFSDLKPVVRAAVSRLNHKPYSVRDVEQVPMTEYQAIRIAQGDSSTTDYFATKMLEANNIRVPGGIGPPPTSPSAGQRRTTGLTAETARRLVQDRANLLVRQSESVTGGTLSSLESLMRVMGQAPGRKLIFFVSDGFFVNDRSTGYGERIARIADAAVRSGAVVYSLDARGVVGMSDASSNRADPQGQLARGNVGELAASQDGLNALAVDTGGKAFFTGDLPTALNEALRETSNYYLLAWRPTTELQKSPNFRRLEVSIPGRPDLTVRVARGFFGTRPKTEETETSSAVAPATPSDSSSSKTVETALISALSAPSARVGIPTRLSVSFVDVPNSGVVLTAATQISTSILGYGADAKAAVDLVGVVLNDQGKQSGSFKTKLNIAQLSQPAGTKDAGVVYNHKIPLKPGLYQVRVAVFDEKSGRVGSAAQWIEIPDLSSKRLTISTLLLGDATKGQTEQMQFSIDRRFSRETQMSFLTLIYNARAAGGAPKLDSQIEILRRGQRVIASPIRPIAIEPNSDLTRIPYGAAIALKTLAPGRYTLRVTVNDRNANESAVEEILFEVE